MLAHLQWYLQLHSPCPLDLAFSDYHIFTSLQHFLEDRLYHSLQVVKNDIEVFTDSKEEDFFQKGIEHFPQSNKQI